MTARVAQELEVPRVRILVNKLARYRSTPPRSRRGSRRRTAARSLRSSPTRTTSCGSRARASSRFANRTTLCPSSSARSPPRWSAMTADERRSSPARMSPAGCRRAERARSSIAIEARTALLASRARRAMARFETERTAAEAEGQFLSALAEGRSLPLRPTIQDLDRHADRWASLVPADPALRAEIAPRGSSRNTACRSRPAASEPRSARTIRWSPRPIGSGPGLMSRRPASRRCRFARASAGGERPSRGGSSRCRRSGWPSRSP